MSTEAPFRPAACARPSRRRFLGLGAGLSLTFMGAGAAFAEPATARRKLVVILCRGAMDGLSAAPPVGDPDYAGLRGAIAIPPDKALPLGGPFALHPKLGAIHQLLLAGQARVAPAVALPQRIRSHFEAQDLLESGGDRLYATTTGWLNRTLAAAGARPSFRALAVGAQEPLILQGPVEAESWSPGGRLNGRTTRLSAVLQDLYGADPLLGPALASGLATEAEAEGLGAQQVKGGDARAVAQTAGRFLAEPDGPSIAVMSLDGFDTHAGQGAAEGQLANRLAQLDGAVDGLRAGLGDAWSRAVVLVATEFGRTARVNGTGGTDHGTASTLILAGGAVKPGAMVGDWPTLAPARLFEGRDLAPTLDIRSLFKGVLQDHLGVDRHDLERTVFPNSREAAPTAGLISA